MYVYTNYLNIYIVTCAYEQILEQYSAAMTSLISCVLSTLGNSDGPSNIFDAASRSSLRPVYNMYSYVFYREDC
jgi:hypothetical protein